MNIVYYDIITNQKFPQYLLRNKAIKQNDIKANIITSSDRDP